MYYVSKTCLKWALIGYHFRYLQSLMKIKIKKTYPSVFYKQFIFDKHVCFINLAVTRSN